jgi:hypothetical protein
MILQHTLHSLAKMTLLGSLWAFTPCVLMAQESTTTTSSTATKSDGSEFVQLTMNDGTLKFGQLIEITESEVVLDIMVLGVTRFPKYLVQAITSKLLSQEDQERGFGYVSNQPSRYFFAPSGIQLKKGKGYFQSNVGINSISYGFSDHFTGGILLSVIGAGLTAKYGGEVRENIHVSVGGVAGIDYFGNLDRPLVLGFANVTFGDEDKNLTINVGVGNSLDRNGGSFDSATTVRDSSVVSNNNSYQTNYFTAFNEIESRTIPLLFNVSAMRPLTSNRWFITENYLVIPWRRDNSVELDSPVQLSNSGYNGSTSPSSYWFQSYGGSSNPGGAISLGIRSYNQRSGWLWDYGLAGVFADGEGFPVPWFSFTLEF